MSVQMPVQFNFEDRHELANGLAKAVADDLAKGIAKRGVASLAVSGGNTPKLFFETLAKSAQIDWSKVVITLVDERWVDKTSERSNARLVDNHLRQSAAEKAKFAPLYMGGDAPSQALIDELNKCLSDKMPFPFDAAILGMGNDGHTASFFPKGDALQAALSAPGPAIAINAPGAGEARVTLTLPVLLKANSLYLHIEGTEKQASLDKALAGKIVEEMPVRAVLFQQKNPVKIYWCP